MRLLEDAEWGRWSNREIARQVGVDEATVRNFRSEALSAGNPQIEPRLVTRNGTTYEMTTANIGNASPPTHTLEAVMNRLPVKRHV